MNMSLCAYVCADEIDTQERKVNTCILPKRKQEKKHEASKTKVKSFVHKTKKVGNEIMKTKDLYYVTCMFIVLFEICPNSEHI